MTFCPFVICYIFQMNNSDKNFRKTDLKNPTIDEKGNYHKANQIAYIPVGSVHDYQNGFNDKYLIHFPFIFFRMLRCYFKRRRTPTGFWNVKICSFLSIVFVLLRCHFFICSKRERQKHRCRGQAYSESKLQRIPRVCDKRWVCTRNMSENCAVKLQQNLIYLLTSQDESRRFLEIVRCSCSKI